MKPEPWTAKEVDYLRKYWPTDKTAQQIANEIGRPLKGVYKKAHLLRLPKKEQPSKIRLSNHDTLWLKLNFPHMRTELCAMRLGISVISCIRLARRYGLNKTEQFIQENIAYSAKKAAECAERLRGIYSPNLQKGRKYQFQKGSCPVWSAERDEFLRNYYPDHTSAFIAEALGLTRFAVENRCRILGLRKRVYRRHG